ncbi:MAG: metalloregulator ArsR/SmtB family transcription factor [Gemmatimonadaceae bacterium]|jgi:ArsR family transcriptional regulator, lead/cadmium/zinc/bismuth-responsive transcriptional repressor|nr:metalloregulator ArsR/SmtB family transcription factor [Gemmatimonadaceae bacterium]
MTAKTIRSTAARDLCEIQYVDELRVQRARQALPDAEAVAALAETFKTLGDPTRLRIVAALAAPDVGELCVCDLATLLGASDSAVSHSLRALRHLRLVRFRREGKIAYYRLDDAHVTQLILEGVRHVNAANGVGALTSRTG